MYYRSLFRWKVCM